VDPTMLRRVEIFFTSRTLITHILALITWAETSPVTLIPLRQQGVTRLLVDSST
jgi:hypothetical protein